MDSYYAKGAMNFALISETVESFVKVHVGGVRFFVLPFCSHATLMNFTGAVNLDKPSEQCVGINVWSSASE